MRRRHPDRFGLVATLFRSTSTALRGVLTPRPGVSRMDRWQPERWLEASVERGGVRVFGLAAGPARDAGSEPPASGRHGEHGRCGAERCGVVAAAGMEAVERSGTGEAGLPPPCRPGGVWGRGASASEPGMRAGAKAACRRNLGDFVVMQGAGGMEGTL
jgi:hypothetical protein